jgi:UDP-2,3-diacylglucosamine pyrophosphatase LpxH
VIVGDFLELWQPPSGIDCVGQGADLGCTISEMVRIVEFVVAAHRDDLALIRDFARRGDNRLIVIPGNHDSSLFLPQVWAPVAAALGAESGRIVLAAAGLWSSADGRIVAEHGHQIGSDVNRYLSWPRITRESQGTTYIERPWGERFVQRIFNDQEEEYEIIDNISPETVGLKYRIADRGFPKTAADLAKFIAFNLFETSVTQKLRSLGRDSPSAVESGLIEWNVKWARDELDYRLIAEALPKDDPLRAAIKGTDTEADGLKAELSSLVKDPTRLADDDVRALCSQLSTMDGPRCDILTAGAAIEVNFFPRQFVLRNHISGRIESHQRMSIFVYGHTHQFEEGWIMSVSSVSSVKVHNTGAFQRTVDESGFLSRIQKRNLAPAEALRAIKLEELAPCYGVVLITYDQSGVPLSDTRLWHMPEGGVGSMVNPGDHRCQ